MKIAFVNKAIQTYNDLPKELKAKADKQFGLILKNFRHPSVKAKKYDEKLDVWQGRLDKSWRFYFKIERDVIFVIAITKHPK
ncbi:MAG: hypothetical protein AAB787_03505 [Patescibacteria group bacterium]